MNAGFSNLTALKIQLLNESLRSDITYDALVAAVGLGVAGLVEGFCNRKFARVEADTLTVPGNSRLISLPRYPVEAVTALDYKVRLATDWVDGLGALYNWSADAGLLDLSNYLTDKHGQARVTYTGGYFWETLEPTDDGYPTTQPDGSAALPEAIRSAWIIQCEYVWSRRDKLGLSLGAKPEEKRLTNDLGTVDLIPLVQQMLKDHIRFAII
ncbi:MAG TPA: hypothetical protein VL357_03035 [Rariglobus sp.]|jgi:hypothetical protein|nr:hypothetical protein [Rariglobus sp.]